MREDQWIKMEVDLLDPFPEFRGNTSIYKIHVHVIWAKSLSLPAGIISGYPEQIRYGIVIFVLPI